MLRLIRRCLNLLNTRDRLYVGLAVLIQLSLILLDLVGLILVGSIVAIATTAVQGTKLPTAIQSLISILSLEQSTPQRVAIFFGVFAAIFMIFKSILSFYFGLRSFAFLARREAKISENLALEIFNQEITALQKYSTPQYQHALTIGSSSVMGGVIGQSLSLTTEAVLQISMLVTLFFFSPLLTLTCLILFFSLFLILNRFQGEKARIWSHGLTRADIATTSTISDAIGSYRETFVNGRRKFFIDEIVKSRREATSFQVNKQMLNQFSKYTFEISVIVAGIGVSAYAFLTKTAIEAASLVAIFLTAAMRIAPSVLKLQQGILQLRGAAGATELFFQIADHVSFSNTSKQDKTYEALSINYSDGIFVKNISYTYPIKDKPALKNISFKIPHRSTFAIVGPSGAGKSTLVDLILGVITPQTGIIDLFGMSPKSFISHFPRIAYVPQNVYLTSGSILENIGLGLNSHDIDINKCWEVLEKVNLKQWVLSLEQGILTKVGERGSKLSGGQRQRIGIARALYQNPILIVLDEATSALDAESEFEISNAINALRVEATTIIIAHRLSTVKNCDSVIYLQAGEIMGQGSFEQLRDLVPNFDRQANLMGINR
jgi:ATP-binding cassette, subfamily B, bacterial PglK